MIIRPDRRMYTKAWMILGTITMLVLAGAALTHLGMALADAAPGAVGLLWAATGAATLLMWLVSAPIIALWIRNLSYRITDTDVLINKGILTKIEQSIPLRMITDFRLNRSLYDRWLGVGSIDVQTAGQSVNTTGYEGRLSGLADWAVLHTDLTGRLQRTGGQPGPREAETELHALVGEVRHIRALLEASHVYVGPS
jgi:putative membrane protein